MDALFLKLLNMSLTACFLILAILPLRALLKKAPRWSICLLWGLVALRLICPVTLKSNLSLIHNSEPVTQEVFILETVPEPAPNDAEVVFYEDARPMPEAWIEAVEDAASEPEKTVPGMVGRNGDYAELCNDQLLAAKTPGGSCYKTGRKCPSM